MSEPRNRHPGAARRILLSARTLVIGHRGARAVAPENTLPSFAAALEAGADLVEFDYRHTADGVPVVLHDATLERTTDAKRAWRGRAPAVAGRTLEELRALDAGSWMGRRFAGTRIPTLVEAIDAIRPRAMPLIERKDGDAATCARILRERSLVNECIVIAFDWSFLRELKRLVPEQVLGALGPSSGGARGALKAATLDRILDMEIDLVVWNSRLNRATVGAAHARGMRVWVFTVNIPSEACRLAETGVDGIITDDPALIRAALARHKRTLT